MKLSGAFKLPGDKSISHRIALLSLIASGECEVSNYSTAQDCITSAKVVNSLGGVARFSGGKLVLSSMGYRLKNRADIDCGNSGTTMRLLMGILASVPGKFCLIGDESLMKRPMERVAKPLRQMGAKISCAVSGIPPVNVEGNALTGIDYTLPVPSAQLKSAILLAGLNAEGVTRVMEPVKSRDHTENMLKAFGGEISFRGGSWSVQRSDIKLPSNFNVPGDPSSAAFFLCGAALIQGSEVVAESILLNPTRIKFLEKINQMGVQIEIQPKGDFPEPWGNVMSRYSGQLSPCNIAPDELPLLIDEVPVLALLATQADGVSEFQEISELRIKESDRIAALVSELGKMGAKLQIKGSNLLINGPCQLRRANSLESFGDHRIAMTLALACLMTGATPSISDISCVSISYPGFFNTMRELAS
ncbi:MAG: 3-phosphoshikimate 1-carboxyvinyltransferase [Desulfomonilaceae bacterium]